MGDTKDLRTFLYLCGQIEYLSFVCSYIFDLHTDFYWMFVTF